jgi:hypothetical protein
MNSKKKLIGFLTAFLLIAIPFAFLFRWGLVENSFSKTTYNNLFEVRLIEVIQVEVTILLALFVSYFLNTVASFSVKRREIFNSLLADFQNELRLILEYSYDYIKNPHKEKEGEIKRKFKQASISISSLYSIAREHKDIIHLNNDFKKNYLQLKRLVTDSPFGESNPKYTEDSILKIQTTYGALLKILHTYRIRLFT